MVTRELTVAGARSGGTRRSSLEHEGGSAITIIPVANSAPVIDQEPYDY